MNNTKKIILVDIDGVLIDFNKGVYDKWKVKHPDLPVIELQNLTKHDQASMYRDLNPSYEALVREILDDITFFDNLDPIDGCLNVLNEMENEGYEVFLCTGIMRKFNTTCSKHEWINKKFGSRWARKIIYVSKDKTLVRGDILIDDKPEITGVLQPTWTHIVFDQPYNRNENKPRIRHWSEWKNVVNNVLSK